jgi:adenylate kinase
VVDVETVVQRLSERWSCPTCHRAYHLTFDPPTEVGRCDDDQTPLERRSDDEESTVRRRLAVYEEQSQPVEAFYREQGLLRPIDADAAEDVVSERALEALGVAGST